MEYHLREITINEDFKLDKKSIRTVMGGYLVQDVDKYDNEIRNSKISFMSYSSNYWYF